MGFGGIGLDRGRGRRFLAVESWVGKTADRPKGISHNTRKDYSGQIGPRAKIAFPFTARLVRRQSEPEVEIPFFFREQVFAGSGQVFGFNQQELCFRPCFNQESNNQTVGFRRRSIGFEAGLERLDEDAKQIQREHKKQGSASACQIS